MEKYIKDIEESPAIDGDIKLIALHEIARMKNGGELPEATFEENESLFSAFTWAKTDMGFDFWSYICGKLYAEE